MTETTVPLRYSAFTETPAGGNPAGVVLDARGMSEDEMLALAAEVGYSETAFLRPRDAGEYDVRYFSPEKEISFCGHATIAAAVALAQRAGTGDLVLAVRTRERLADLDYDFGRLKAFMLERDLTTVDLVWRERADTYHARNPFPVGGVVEDPKTGAAAAAIGAYLRELGLAKPPARIAVLQGDDMGRPSRLTVELTPDRPEIAVSGRAVAIA